MRIQHAKWDAKSVRRAQFMRAHKDCVFSKMTLKSAPPPTPIPSQHGTRCTRQSVARREESDAAEGEKEDESGSSAELNKTAGGGGKSEEAVDEGDEEAAEEEDEEDGEAGGGGNTKSGVSAKKRKLGPDRQPAPAAKFIENTRNITTGGKTPRYLRGPAPSAPAKALTKGEQLRPSVVLWCFLFLTDLVTDVQLQHLPSPRSGPQRCRRRRGRRRHPELSQKRP